MTFKLSQRSLDNLKCVHPDLVALVKEAIKITEVDFAVIEGLRTIERQKQLIAQGASKTMRSRHLTGHAVDLAAYVAGGITWKPQFYKPIAKAMKLASNDLNIPVEWGGNWLTFKDLVHFQLPWKEYP